MDTCQREQAFSAYPVAPLRPTPATKASREPPQQSVARPKESTPEGAPMPCEQRTFQLWWTGSDAAGRQVTPRV